MCRRPSLIVTLAAAIWLKVSMQSGVIVSRLHQILGLARPRRHLVSPARALAAGGKAKTRGPREREHSLTSLISLVPRAGRCSTTSAEGVCLLPLVGRGRPTPVAGPNRAQATYPTGGRWRRGTILGTPWIRILAGAGPDPLAYVRTGPVSFTKPAIVGASHHRACTPTFGPRRSLNLSGCTCQEFGVWTVEHNLTHCGEISGLLGLQTAQNIKAAIIPQFTGYQP